MNPEFLEMLRARLMQTLGQAPVQPMAPTQAKRGGRTGKVLASQQAARSGVGVERHPPERIHPDQPGAPGSGVSRVEHTSRPMTLAELERFRRMPIGR